MTEQPDDPADDVIDHIRAHHGGIEPWQETYLRRAYRERMNRGADDLIVGDRTGHPAGLGPLVDQVRTTGTAYDPPADPIAALRQALDRIRAATREVLVHPDTPAVVIERITSATPLLRVRRSSLVPRPDVVLVSRPDGQGPLVVPGNGAGQSEGSD